MKTKAFLLFCLFLCLGLTRLSAQQWWPLPPNGDTGSISFYEEWNGYSVPVYINGVLVDELTGTVKMHNVLFVHDGVPIHATQHMYGEIHSSNPPFEVFEVSDMSHVFYAADIWTLRTTVIGNMGTHYIMNFLYDPFSGELTPVKTMVVGKVK
jgi:hypothetical protein